MTYIYRPGAYNVTDSGRARIAQPGFSAATPWWLSGGIAAANCVAAYTPKGAVSLAASYDNNAAPGNGLPDGTYDAALGVAPTWAAGTGWAFDGVSMYLTTGITSVAGGWSMILRFSEIGVVNRYLAATFATEHFGIGPLFNNGTAVYFRNKTSAPVAPGLTAGTLCIAGASVYRNGTQEAGVSLFPSLSVAVPALYIGCRNNNGTPDMYSDGKVQAFAIYNATLTAPQVAAVSTAMMAL